MVSPDLLCNVFTRLFSNLTYCWAQHQAQESALSYNFSSDFKDCVFSVPRTLLAITHTGLDLTTFPEQLCCVANISKILESSSKPWHSINVE